MRVTLGLVYAAVALGAGCDWRDFDSIQTHTPVLSVSAPSHFAASDDFGRYLLPLSGPAADSTGGTFVVSAESQAALALINVDATGQVHGQNVDAPALEPAIGGDVSLPVTAMAEVPGANQVLLGVPDANGTGAVYLMTLAATPTIAAFATPPTTAPTRFGLGVAAGQLAGADAPELVVASSSDLTIFLDGDATKGVTAPADPACPLVVSGGLSDEGKLPNRPILLAPRPMGLGEQLIVGTPATTGGNVSIWAVDATTGVASCAFSYTQPDAGFGMALALGDFDGDGVPDLLIGSPPSHAFWVHGPLSATSQVTPVTLTAGSGTALGASVAAANVDGVPGDEALVGDPDAVRGGANLSGEVHVVGGASLDTEQTILHRQSPSSSDAFGVEAHALPFCTSGCGTATAVTQNVPLVASTTHAFLFFHPELRSTDPRTK
ncbi:MAG TPA: FG-GAP repeat protein [Polyangia bacterium]|jgi:hypothetical protein|nr:FG-GAP repeat protein [Polyangia bacterium]